jgi:hypothetical protein
MENNSIFNKLNQVKEEKAESKEVNKEQMHQEVLLEIEELKQKKQEYLDLYEKITSEKAELSANHEEYKKALEGVLAVFENEEAKALLAEQGVDGVQSLLREHPDTDEAKNLVATDASVKENLAKLKELKAEIIEKLDIQNPEYKTLNKVAAPLSWAADSIDREIFQKSIDTVEGRISWPVSYPTGIWHKENKFEKEIKENKEPKIREIYHELGDKIDTAFIEAIKEYEATEGHEELRPSSTYKEGRHIFSRGPIVIDTNLITFYFGSGYSQLEYRIKENDQGNLSFSRIDNFKALLPQELIDIFNKKLRQVDDSFKSVAENI